MRVHAHVHTHMHICFVGEDIRGCNRKRRRICCRSSFGRTRFSPASPPCKPFSPFPGSSPFSHAPPKASATNLRLALSSHVLVLPCQRHRRRRCVAIAAPNEAAEPTGSQSCARMHVPLTQVSLASIRLFPAKEPADIVCAEKSPIIWRALRVWCLQECACMRVC